MYSPTIYQYCVEHSSQSEQNWLKQSQKAFIL